MQDVILKWETHVAEHQQYQTSYNACVKWMNDLSRKLLSCTDTTGDKQVIEDRQARLQVSWSELAVHGKYWEVKCC